MENNKGKKGIIIALLIIIILLLSAIIYLLLTQNTNSNKQNNENNNVVDQTKTENSEKCDKNSIRTYRFFGYVESNGPDMYTTLKLYSDNKYDFYVNDCSGVKKYSGEYTESDDSIVLKGENTFTFKKQYDGDILDFNGANVGACHDSGGTFSLENSTLDESYRE